jgi:hypothetical protein
MVAQLCPLIEFCTALPDLCQRRGHRRARGYVSLEDNGDAPRIFAESF